MDDRRLVVTADGILERHPPPMQPAGERSVRFGRPAKPLRVREEFGGESLPLAGNAEKKRLDGRIPDVIRRVAESALAVAACVDQAIQRPPFVVFRHGMSLRQRVPRAVRTRPGGRSFNMTLTAASIWRSSRSWLAMIPSRLSFAQPRQTS